MYSKDLLNSFDRFDLEHKASLEDQRKLVMKAIAEKQIQQKDIAQIPMKYLDVTDLPGVPSANVMTHSLTYKPFRYEFGFKMWERQNQIHWMHTMVPLNKDIKDWNEKLTDTERSLATHIFPLFVENDKLVNNVYIHEYARVFRANELQLAFSAIANMESTHQVAYSHLLTELGFTDKQYSMFMEFKEMYDKYNFTAGFRMDTLLGIAVAMVVFGALTEGLQLFGSFITLFNFSRFNKLTGMGQIVSWSVKDEDLHVLFVAKLFKTFMVEFGHLIDRAVLENAVNRAVRMIVKNEHSFFDLAFDHGGVEGMTLPDTKRYICYTADQRLQQFGFPIQFGDPNPFESWSHQLMGGIEHANFFETRAIEYSKATTQGEWTDDCFN